MTPLWPLLMLAALPAHDAFLFELEGVPVGLVELSRPDEGRFHYVSTQLFVREGERVSRRFEARVRTDAQGRRSEDGRAPSALWLWRRPSRGCVPGFDERTGRTGELCAAAGGAVVEGTALGERFRAEYGPDGALRLLELGAARFVRTATHVLPEGAGALFGDGFPAPPGGGALVLEGASSRGEATPIPASFSSDAEARALADELRAALERREPGADPTGACLAQARRFVARSDSGAGPRARVVLGLHAPPGEARAYPHAWVEARVGARLVALDPTLGVPVRAATHLRIGGVGDVEAGRAYLALASGEARLVRR